MRLRTLLLIAFVLSGMAALVYELTWIRPLQFLLGSTIYTISIIFAVFMLGLSIGAWLMSKHVERINNLPAIYALIELGIGLYGILLLSIFNILPGIYNRLYFLHTQFYVFEFVQFLLVFVVLLVPTTLMGATWPIITKFYAKERIGKGVGELYFANNLGAIIGSLGAGFLLIPLFGIKASVMTAGIINILVGSTIFAVTAQHAAKKIIPITLALFLAFAYFGNYSITQMHSGGFYRTSPIYKELGPVLYYEEGLYATVTVRDVLGKGKALFINGKGQGGYEITDLRVNFLLAYLPYLLNPATEKALVIGLGTGTTSGQISQLSKTTTIEIEPKILGAVPYFSIFNLHVLENPNHEAIIDDGRNWLLKNKEKYDVIIPEPSDPWQSFSGVFYSKEYFEMVAENLEENGLFVQWVPIYEMSADDFRRFYKTFTEVFPYNAGFANIKPDENTLVRFETSELILVGSKNEVEINEEKFVQHYDSLPEQSRKYLDGLRLSSGKEIHHLLLFTNEQLRGYADDAEFLTDDKPTLEFSTAKKVFVQNPKEVIDDIGRFVPR